MKKDLSEALDLVEGTYSELVKIANNILDDIFSPINNIVDEIRNEGAGAPVESIRSYLLRVQLKAYEISDVKEKSALKAECSEAIRKESYARAFNEAQGTAGTKDNTAFLSSSENLLVEEVYNLVANLLKTKLDELHRLVAVLQSILMSKMQEAKLAINGVE